MENEIKEEKQEEIGAEQKKVYVFGEEYHQVGFDREQIKMTEILEKEIIIEDFYLIDDQFESKSAVIAFTLDGAEKQTIIGSSIVVSQLGHAKTDKKLPIKATITKAESKEQKRPYFTLV